MKIFGVQTSGKTPVSLIFVSAQAIASGLGGQLLILISGPLVARLLGVTGRGYFAGLALWPILLISLGNLGVPVSCTYFLNRLPEQARQTLGEAYRIAFLQIIALSVLLAVLLFYWGHGKPSEVKNCIFWVLLMIPAGIGQHYALAVLQGQQRFTAFNTLRLLPPALYTLGGVVLFLLDRRSLFTVVAVWVVTALLAAIVSTVVAIKDLLPDWHSSPNLRRQLLAFGLRGHLGAVSPVDSLPIDQAIVAIFLSPATLGAYVVACAFTNLPRFIAQSAGKIVYPAVAVRQGPAAVILIWRSFWSITLFNVVVATGLILAMPMLVIFFFGTEFSPAVSVARILLVGTTLVASRQILMEGLRGLGYPSAATLAEISMYPWLVIAGPLLISQYGVEGLAAALTIGYGISLAVAVLVHLRLETGSSSSTAVFTNS